MKPIPGKHYILSLPHIARTRTDSFPAIERQPMAQQDRIIDGPFDTDEEARAAQGKWGGPGLNEIWRCPDSET